VLVIRSRDNDRVKAWSRLADDPVERRSRGLALIEGAHLLETYLDRCGAPVSLIVSETAASRPDIGSLLKRCGMEPALLADNLFKRISDTKAPAGIAAEIRIPGQGIDPAASAGCVFLEGIQDAGNVGAILRSVAAFGVSDVLLAPGCADPWSPKALRAAMGGHFFIRLGFSEDFLGDVKRFGQGSVCTVARDGTALDKLDLRGRVGWIFGSEGSGVSEAVVQAASQRATIPMPGGAESLNVAMSAAICLYEQRRQVNTRAAGS
jgi:TrmH family RNA methyltransferase